MDQASAETALASSLRTQVSERVKAQQQIITVAAAVAGAVISFASGKLADHPEVMALLCLLYVGLSLSLLRQDQEITIIADHLLDIRAFGLEAQAQSRWESHKFAAMQTTGVAVWLTSASQTVGIYGVPVLAVVACGWATLGSEMNTLAWLVISIACLGALIFVLGAADVVRRYRGLGYKANANLNRVGLDLGDSGREP